MPIDTSIKFIPINIAIITISDTRDINNDNSGNILESRIKILGHKIIKRKIIKDDIPIIKKTLIDFSIHQKIDCIIIIYWPLICLSIKLLFWISKRIESGKVSNNFVSSVKLNECL